MIPERVAEVLDKHGLEALEFEEGSTSTSEAAAEIIGVCVGQIAKSILFTGKDGRFCMVLCAGDRRISSSRLKRMIGFKPRMATPDETKKMTGFDPGGVCPFGLKDVLILADVSLRDYDIVYPAAGTDSSGVPILFDKLCDVTGAVICDVTSSSEG